MHCALIVSAYTCFLVYRPGKHNPAFGRALVALRLILPQPSDSSNSPIGLNLLDAYRPTAWHAGRRTMRKVIIALSDLVNP